MLPFDLLLITDRAACHRAGRTVTETVALALRAASPVRRIAVLLRDKPSSPMAKYGAEARLRQATALKAIAEGAGALLLVHSYPDIAVNLKLAGVHVAASTNLAMMRDRLSSTMLLGASRHAHDALDETDLAPATYATISPVYAPTSKPGDRRLTLGLSGLQACVARSARPLVALGGMRPGRARAAMACGAAAIAVSGAVMQASDPARVANQLLDEIVGARLSADTSERMA